MTKNLGFEDLKKHFVSDEDIEFRGTGVKLLGKMFIWLVDEGLRIKLPKDRVAELIASGIGLPYVPGNGQIPKEWVVIPQKADKEWIKLAIESKKFIETQIKK